MGLSEMPLKGDEMKMGKIIVIALCIWSITVAGSAIGADEESIWEVEPNDDFSLANQIEEGKIYSGIVTFSDGDVDYWKMTIPKDRIITVAIASGNLNDDIYLYLYNEARMLEESAHSVDGSVDSIVYSNRMMDDSDYYTIFLKVVGSGVYSFKVVYDEDNVNSDAEWWLAPVVCVSSVIIAILVIASKKAS